MADWWREPLEATGLRFVGHSDLGGYGDGSQIMRQGNYLYVAHMRRMGTTVLDVSDPERPEVVWQQAPPPNTHSHKVQTGDGLLIVNHERMPGRAHGQASTAAEPHSAGIQLYDIATDPARPRPLGFLDVGGLGVHRPTYTGGPYAYLCGAAGGFAERMLTIADVSDPTAPKQLGQWWLPGLWTAGGERPTWPAGETHGLHHVVVHGDRAYGGLLDSGIGVLDVSDPNHPRLAARLTWPAGWGGFAHTALPLPARRLIAVAQEQTVDGEGPPCFVRLVDAADEANLREIAVCPEPSGDYRQRGGRFGPHNLHENRPGSRLAEDRLYVTYFNAGLRVYDISDAAHPREAACYVPAAPPGQVACQINDVLVDDRFVYITDRIGGGLWILEED